MDSLQNIYCIYLSTRDIEEEKVNNKIFNCECLEVTFYGDEPSTATIKQSLINLQKEYDSSDEVNIFYINNQPAWMDKATRVGLMNSMNILEQAGQTQYTVWLNNTPYTADIAMFKQVIAAVELYAMQCYAVTEQHLAEIEQLNSREEYLNYKVHTGYPEKLNFTI